jgi:hypothetical protein
VADKTQDKVRELRELVVAYTKQETIDPLKGLARYAGFGIGGAVLLGAGVLFLGIGLLRLLQDETGTAFTGNWSWVPYAITIAAMGIVIAAAFGAVNRISRRRKKQKTT